MYISDQIGKELGLSDKEILLYELLLAKNKTNAKILIKESGLKRATVYTILDVLIKKGLVQALEHEPVLQYRARHPFRMKELAEDKVRNIQTAEQQLEGVMPQLIHLYQSHQNRPGVKFYEGKDGIQTVLNDSLTAKEDILTYADVESIMKYIPDINKEYAKKRDKLNIVKRGIMIDSPFIRSLMKEYYPKTTPTKLIKWTPLLFKTIMQIYDGKVSYITLDEKVMIGVIITDKFIYEMHKHYFEYLWSITPDPVI